MHAGHRRAILGGMKTAASGAGVVHLDDGRALREEELVVQL
jgi:hypothetical protein